MRPGPVASNMSRGSEPSSLPTITVHADMGRVAVVAAILVLAACTPAERAWLVWQARPLPGPAPACAQWLGTVRVAGFDDTQLRTALAVMRAGGGWEVGAGN